MTLAIRPLNGFGAAGSESLIQQLTIITPSLPYIGKVTIISREKATSIVRDLEQTVADAAGVEARKQAAEGAEAAVTPIVIKGMIGMAGAAILAVYLLRKRK